MRRAQPNRVPFGRSRSGLCVEGEPNRFISVRPWESEEAIASWRAPEGSQQRVGAIGELLESFESRVFEIRRELGDVA